MQTESIVPPVKCATGLRYAPTSSMSKISLVFLNFLRKRKIAAREEKGNRKGKEAPLGAENPTKVPPKVFALFTQRRKRSRHHLYCVGRSHRYVISANIGRADCRVHHHHELHFCRSRQQLHR